VLGTLGLVPLAVGKSWIPLPPRWVRYPGVVLAILGTAVSEDAIIEST
jgi:hypothetical protein